MKNYIKYFGWIDDPVAIREMQRKLGIQSLPTENIADSGKKQIVLLHNIFKNVTGKNYPVWKQGIGDCVSFGYALGASTLMAFQISEEGGIYPADVATEPIYGGSRVEIGGGRLGCEEDGSHGIWAANWVRKYGILLRQKYGEINLKRYKSNRAKIWGCEGVPDELEPIARRHPIHSCALVRSYEEARDAIANGYPVPVCSNRGFRSRRDSEGFAAPYGTWYHCMLFMAVDDAHSRPGLLCCNSWGRNWIDGGKRHNQPDGSFWVDAEVADSMLKQGDSYALSQFKGFRPQLKIMQSLMKNG